MKDWIRWSLRLALALALFYAAWVFYERWETKQRAATEAEYRERTRVKGDLDRAGGSSLKITQFYASPSAIAKGQTAQLCYGVLFAEKVELIAVPHAGKLEDVWPSLQRCVDVSPKANTEYTLKAIDKAGATVTQAIKVEVR